MNEVEEEYTGKRVTYSCGTVLYVERVSPRSFSECKECGETYPLIVSSERWRHLEKRCCEKDEGDAPRYKGKEAYDMVALLAQGHTIEEADAELKAASKDEEPEEPYEGESEERNYKCGACGSYEECDCPSPYDDEEWLEQKRRESEEE